AGPALRVVDDRDLEERVGRQLAAEQLPGEKRQECDVLDDGRGDAPARVADDGRVAEPEPEDDRRIDPVVEAADHDELRGRQAESRSGVVTGELLVAFEQRRDPGHGSSFPVLNVDAVHINVISGRCPLCYPGTVTASQSAEEVRPGERRRRPRGAVRDGLVAAGLELASTGGPDAVVLREATRMVGVVPNAAYRHFADRDELLAAVCAAAMDELARRMAAGVAQVPGEYGYPVAAGQRLGAIGAAYLAFARDEPGLFATA